MAKNNTHTMRFEMLSRDNYDPWKIQAEALLVKNDFWSYVSGDSPRPALFADSNEQAQTAHKTWTKADQKAKADLILAIKPSELHHILCCTTSREVWLKLESVYASKGPARKATLLKRLTQHKMEEGDDSKNHLSGFFEAEDKLQSMDVEINGDLLSIMLLHSLPSTFENFRCAIESRDVLPDTESPKIKIVEEYHAIQKDGGNGNGAMFAKANQNSLQGGSRNGQPRNEKSSSQSKPKPSYSADIAIENDTRCQIVTQ